jgi:YD repeat-containing protein
MHAQIRRVRYLVPGILVALFLLAPDLAGVSAATVTYEHDLQGRVKKATYSDGTIVDYSYDANGNRITAVVTPGTPVPPDTTAPSAPGAPAFSSIAGTSATASWTAATDNVGVTSYEYQLNAGGWQSIGNVLTRNLTNLVSGASYTFNVRARDAAGNFGPASSGNFSTPDTVAPTVPSNVTASSAVSTTVNVSWAASTDNVAVTGYKVFRNGGQIGTSATTSYADNTVSGSTAYAYKVSAYDAATNNSAQSAVANVTTPDTIAPTTPTGLTATPVSSTQVNLSWNAASDSGGSGLAGYRIYRNGSQINTSATNSYSDTTASPATTYSYTVAAYDGATNLSGQSTAAQATTSAALSASVSSTTWSWRRRGANTPVVDPDIVVTASGGSGAGFTYLWQWVSGDTQASAISPTSSSTKWSHPVPNQATDYISVWRCRVIDSAGTTVYTPNVTVKFRRDTIQ